MLQNLINLQTELIPGLASKDAGQAGKSGVETIAADMAQLKSLSLEDLLNRLAESAVDFAINLAIAIVVFYAGRFIIRKIFRLVSAIFIRRGLDRSLSTFVLSLINIVLYFILIVTVIGILGIETTSFLALFASAGVAIGMALSGTLQNFAGGVLILLLKPYKIGDYIEAQGYAGTVKEIQIFFTVITTPDNKSISIPNGGLSTASVNNWTREAYRRVSWTVALSYGDDVDAAREAIFAKFAADERVMPMQAKQPDNTPMADADGNGADEEAMPTPADNDVAENAPAHKRTFIDKILFRHREAKRAISRWEEKHDAKLAAWVPTPDFSPEVLVGELGSSSVILHVRAWTLTPNYWDVFFSYNEWFYKELPLHGIHFPYPQVNVHMAK